MEQIVKRQQEDMDRNLADRTSHGPAYQPSRVPVEKRIPPSRLIYSQIHLSTSPEHARILREGAAGVPGVMQDAIGNHQIRMPVLDRETEIVSDYSRQVTAILHNTHRHRTDVQTDAIQVSETQMGHDATG